MSRFDEIAAVYDAQIPEHVRSHLLIRKTDMMTAYLGDLDKSRAAGLDLGCGTGWHVERLRQQGFRVIGIDSSLAQIQEARHRPAGSAEGCWCLSDIQCLPCAEQSVDFAFAINVIHHLETREKQILTVQELHRVLKPNGLFFLHEINTTNAVMSLYMNHVFPRVRRIDNGLEHWIAPDSLQQWPGFAVIGLSYFTFVPDFTPKALYPLMAWVEQGLERSPLRSCAAHYMAVLRRV